MARTKGSKNGVRQDNTAYTTIFCVFNNPNSKPIWEDGQSHYDGNDYANREIVGWQDTEYTGLTPQQTLEKFINKWVEEDKDNRTGIATYCIAHASEGQDKWLKHIHAVLCSKKTFRFTDVQKLFPGMHISPTKGTKKEALNYIRKQGDYAPDGKKGEKDEIVVEEYGIGEVFGSERSRNDMKAIEGYIRDGLTPQEIYAISFGFRRYTNMIEKAYLDKKIADTPVVQDIEVFWHFGQSGTGKSHRVVDLVNEYGRENVYIVPDLGSSGAFDGYCGQDIIFIDELRPHTIKYNKLLMLLDEYTHEIPARYYNRFKCWKQVHITTPYHPEDFYEEALGDEQKHNDYYEQLRRRITHCIYHSKKDGEFLEEEIDLTEEDITKTVHSHKFYKDSCTDSQSYSYYSNLNPEDYF